jgi:excisionase family DNA binding protein
MPRSRKQRDKFLLRPNEAAELLSISRSKAYTLIAAGVLPSVDVGGSVRVPVEQLQAWIKRHTNAEGEDADAPPGPRRTSAVR